MDGVGDGTMPGVSLPRHAFPLQWSSPPASKHDPTARLEAGKKKPQRATRRGAAGASTAESLEQLLAPAFPGSLFPRGLPAAVGWTAPEPVHWAARSGHFHSMQWKWKWHFCNLHHVTSVNAPPLDCPPPSSPPSRPRPMGISTAVDRETLHESRRAVTAASRRVPSPTLDASEQFTWTTTLDTRRRASLTRHKPADEPAPTPTRAAGD